MTDTKNIETSASFLNNSSTNSEIDQDRISIRGASRSDMDNIFELLHSYAEKGLLLPPTNEDIAKRIDTFVVAELAVEFVACASLRNFGNNLFEIRSLAVSSECAGKRIGTKLVNYLLQNYKLPAGSRVFALTYRSHFFERLGFKSVEKELFPEKIWHDCDLCPKKDHCDEQAVMLTIPKE